MSRISQEAILRYPQRMHARGSRMLSHETVEAIRQDGRCYREIAEQYGVSKPYVCMLKKFKRRALVVSTCAVSGSSA